MARDKKKEEKDRPQEKNQRRSNPKNKEIVLDKKLKWKVFARKLWTEGLKQALTYAADCTDNSLDDIGVDLVDKVVTHVTKKDEEEAVV